jgi:hypothetical protein
MGWRDMKFVRMMAMASEKKTLFKKLSTGRKVEAEKN